VGTTKASSRIVFITPSKFHTLQTNHRQPPMYKGRSANLPSAQTRGT
jgi:hypothetical protein